MGCIEIVYSSFTKVKGTRLIETWDVLKYV